MDGIGGLLAAAGGGGVVGGAIARLLLDTSHFDKGLASSESRLQALAHRSSSIGGALTRNLSAPLALIGAGATAMALKYEDAFTRIDAVSNASAASLAKWRTEVLQLAGRTAQSPQELAEALYFLASAGLKAGTEMDALEASAKASAIGLGETAVVARIVANALNAYADSGLTAVGVVDRLTAAIKAGTAEPDEFADALGRVLPIAAAAGVGFDEVTASLAALSNIGLDVEEGVTALRGLLQALVAPGGQAAKTMQALGISTEEMRRTLAEGGVLAALQLLQERSGGNLDVLRDLIPNVRALTGELGLTGQNAATVAKVFDQVTAATNELERAWEATTGTPAHEMRQAMVDIQIAAVELGQKLLPVAQKIVDVVVRLADWFAKLPDGMQQVVVVAGLIAVALGPLLRLWGAMVGILAGATAATHASTAAMTAQAAATTTAAGASTLYIASARGVVVGQQAIGASALVASGQVNTLKASMLGLAAAIPIGLGGVIYNPAKVSTSFGDGSRLRGWRWRTGPMRPRPCARRSWPWRTRTTSAPLTREASSSS